MRVIFCRKSTLGSWLIRAFTWSRWSHCMIVEGPGTIIDATFTHGGVRRRALLAAVAETSAREEVHIPLTDDQEFAALTWLASQLGKPYDWTAIVGIFFRQTGWAEPDAWFCSELLEAALRAAGRPRFRDDISRITPRDSWAVIST